MYSTQMSLRDDWHKSKFIMKGGIMSSIVLLSTWLQLVKVSIEPDSIFL